MKPKIFRDAIHGDIQVDTIAHALINDPLFQRLKRISQNGFLYLIYPGMKHSRFEHSLGAYHIACKWITELSDSKSVENKLRELNKGTLPSGNLKNGVRLLLNETFETMKGLKEQWGNVVRVAALIHDLGHGPLSHTLEKCDLLTLSNCEDWITSPEIKKFITTRQHVEHEDFTLLYLNRLIINHSSVFNFSGTEENQFIERVASLLHKDFRKQYLKANSDDSEYVNLFANLISSLFDVDRMDYLRRDSQKAGVEYGNVDVERIINTVSPVLYKDAEGTIKSGFLTDARNVHVLDHLLISLFEMYTILYLHPRNISTDHEFKRLITLLKDLGKVQRIDITDHSNLDEWKFLEHINNESKGFLKKLLDRQTPKADLYQMFSKESFEPDEHLQFISQKSKRPFFKGDEKVFLAELSYPKKVTKLYPWDDISLVAKNLNSETYAPQVWWKNEKFESELETLKSELSELPKAQGATNTKS